MSKILKKEVLSPDVKLFVVEAKEIAKKAEPGQFIILMVSEEGERIPLTIADFSRDDGTLTLVVQEVGVTTKKMGKLEEGDDIPYIVGPLGKPSDVVKRGLIVCIGGGIGIAPIYPIARKLKELGNEVISIIGARTKDILFWEEKMGEVSSELIVTTDDGSYGKKGFVTQVLQGIIDSGREISEVMAIGPVPMMKAVSDLTKTYGIKTVVSLNPIMVDGTGMCGGCRVDVDGEKKFCCVDGPEFDAHYVDFEGLIQRQQAYKEEEQQG